MIPVLSSPANRNGRHRAQTVLLVACLGIYLFCAIASLDEPPVGDVTDFLVAADKMAGILDRPQLVAGRPTIGLWHPTAYVELLALCGKVFGTSIVARRAIGMVFFLLSALLTFLIARRVQAENNLDSACPVLAVCLLLISPLAIKGSVHLDIDNTILTTAVLLLVHVFLVSRGRETTLKYAALLAVLFGLCLWVKMTTPIAVMGAIFLFHAIQRRLKYGLRAAFVPVLIGGGLFFITWVGYCHFQGFSWRAPFNHLLGSLTAKTAGASGSALLSSLSRAIVRIGLWFSPYLLIPGLLAAAIGVHRLAKTKDSSAVGFISLLFLIIVAGYLCVGRFSHGLPKYHFPALPLCCVLVSYIVCTRLDCAVRSEAGSRLAGSGLRGRICLIGGSGVTIKDIVRTAVALVLLVLFHVFCVGDLLLLTDYSLKEALVLHPESFRSTMLLSAVRAAAFLVLPAVLFVWRMARRNARDAAWSSLLLLLCVATFLGMNAGQFRPGYLTIYGYGIRGVEETVQYAREAVPQSAGIVGSYEIVYLSGRQFPNPTPDSALSSVRGLGGLLGDPSVRMLVMCIGGHTLRQFQSVLGPSEVGRLLEEHYVCRQIGSYLVWTRRE